MAIFYLALGLSRLFRGRCAEQSHADDHPVTVYAYIMRPITKTGHQVSVCFDVVCGYIYAGQWHGQQSQSAGRSRGCCEIENRKMLGRVTGTNCDLWGLHGRGWSTLLMSSPQRMCIVWLWMLIEIYSGSSFACNFIRSDLPQFFYHRTRKTFRKHVLNNSVEHSKLD